jgi:serine/threonine protein kinase
MGEVYKARDPRLNRMVAVKLLPAAAGNDAERRERFEREAQAVASLNQPGIVTIHSVEQDAGQFFLTMELVEGRSLTEAMPPDGWPLDRLLKIAITVADAMAAAHQKGITHRDLKPANIMLGEGEHGGRVKVLDFGLAKLADVPTATGEPLLPTALATITGEGQILGTVAYMSPEHAEGKPIDARSDLFSLGVILYEMATRRRPFTGDTAVSIIDRQRHTQVGHRDQPGITARSRSHHRPRAQQGSRAPLSDGERPAQRSRGTQGVTRLR